MDNNVGLSLGNQRCVKVDEWKGEKRVDLKDVRYKNKNKKKTFRNTGLITSLCGNAQLEVIVTVLACVQREANPTTIRICSQLIL